MENTNTVLDAVLDVFSNVGTWIADSVQNLIPMFYDEGSLTFLGVLAVAGLAISVIFMMLGVIQNFLHFRG